MRLQDSDIAFLKGRNFSTSFVFSLAFLTRITPNRIEFLRELARGKRVIHVGCVDHLALIEEKRKRGTWLHEVLSQSAARCVGVDINREGCEHLNRMGFKDIFCFDAIVDQLPYELKTQTFDYLILGEMIEHVDNPVEFLSAVREKFSGVAHTIVTTTPNVFRFHNLLDSLRSRERINSDHRYWFSPYTLAKVLSQAGYEQVDINTVWHSPSPRKVVGWIKIAVGFMFPLTKDCLIAKANLN